MKSVTSETAGIGAKARAKGKGGREQKKGKGPKPVELSWYVMAALAAAGRLVAGGDEVDPFLLQSFFDPYARRLTAMGPEQFKEMDFKLWLMQNLAVIEGDGRRAYSVVTSHNQAVALMSAMAHSDPKNSPALLDAAQWMVSPVRQTTRWVTGCFAGDRLEIAAACMPLGAEDPQGQARLRDNMKRLCESHLKVTLAAARNVLLSGLSDADRVRDRNMKLSLEVDWCSKLQLWVPTLSRVNAPVPVAGTERMIPKNAEWEKVKEWGIGE